MHEACGGTENKYSFNQRSGLFFSKVTFKFKCASHIYLKRDFKTRDLPGFTDYYFQVSVCTRFQPCEAQLIPSSCGWSENRAIITDSFFSKPDSDLSWSSHWLSSGFSGWFLDSYAGFPHPARSASQSCVSSPRWIFAVQGFTSQLPPAPEVDSWRDSRCSCKESSKRPAIRDSGILTA